MVETWKKGKRVRARHVLNRTNLFGILSNLQTYTLLPILGTKVKVLQRLNQELNYFLRINIIAVYKTLTTNHFNNYVK